MTFTIIGRQTNGTKVDGYILRDLSTNRLVIKSKEEVYELAKNKQIEDVITQEYKGRVILKGTKSKISQLPNYDANGNRVHNEDCVNKQIVIANGRVMDGKNIVAYKLALIERNMIKKEVMVSRDEMIDLASRGAITNVRHQKSNGEDILRGIGCKLSELPIIYQDACYKI